MYNTLIEVFYKTTLLEKLKEYSKHTSATHQNNTQKIGWLNRWQHKEKLSINIKSDTGKFGVLKLICHRDLILNQNRKIYFENQQIF